MTNGRWKVLVVDDEPNNLQLLGQILRDQYQLSFARNGIKALEAVGKIKPDIILLDIMMPEMDGYEVLSRLKADPETSRIPVIFVTARTKTEDERKGFELGAVDYISKPISPPIANARIKNHLELKKVRDHLEERVKERTADLAASNANLRKEIDTRRQTEKLLRDNQEMLGSVLDSFPEVAFLIEESGKIIMANDASAVYCGIKEGERIMGLNISDCLSPEEAEKRNILVSQVIAGKEPRYYESIHDGKTLRHYIYPVFDRRGEVTCLANLSFDITAQRQMEMQLIQSEKLASIGFLVSGVAHEINNPNNFISFNIPILRDYLKDLLPIVDEYVESHGEFEPSGMPYPEFRDDLFKILLNIEHGSKRIHRTVSLLQDFSRKQDKIVTFPVDIQDVFEKALSISEGKVKRMVKTLRVNVAEGMPRIPSDPHVIEHIVINLLINAAQAADKEDSWVEMHARPGDSRRNRFIIEVRDNGAGMDRETMTKAFEPFFTTKPPGEGTGLGLSLCHNLASSLGGKMELESEPGKGSTFRLVLPDNQA